MARPRQIKSELDHASGSKKKVKKQQGRQKAACR
jgi:hypothetical protein